MDKGIQGYVLLSNSDEFDSLILSDESVILLLEIFLPFCLPKSLHYILPVTIFLEPMCPQPMVQLNL